MLPGQAAADCNGLPFSRRGNEAVEAGDDLISKLYDVGPERLRESIAERGIVLGGKPERVDDVNRGRVVNSTANGPNYYLNGVQIGKEAAESKTLAEIVREIADQTDSLALYG